ncbi:trypsin-like peptidase domain-containing protein [bacterium]|nr:trypsin-like peptidase domain-containing protein [bacterium]
MDPRIASQHRGAKSLLLFFVLLFGVVTGILLSNGLDWIPKSVAQGGFSTSPAGVEPSDFLVSTQESFRDIVAAVRPAVVSIQAEGTQTLMEYGSPFGEQFEFPFDIPDPFGRPDRNRDRNQPEEEFPVYSAGSGFLVNPNGYILTNNHVVANADEITVVMDDGQQFDAEIIGSDSDSDVAVLKIEDSEPFPYLEIADSDELQVGDWVMAVGNPFGNLAGSVTVGIVSATNREQLFLQGGAYYQDFIQTDAAINLGNSGGPLVDIHGRAVGINTAISSQGSGIGFAIPMSIAGFVYEGFLEYGEVIRGWIGVTIQNIDPDLAEAFGLESIDGAIVIGLTEGNPADEGGLWEGDVILQVGGEHVSSTSSASRVIAALPVGEPAEFIVWRDGEEIAVAITPIQRDSNVLQPADEPIEDEDVDNSKPTKSERNTEYLGIEVEELDREIIEFYDLPEGITGVIVAYVDPSSVAFEKGMREGLIIVSISGEDVVNLDDYDRLMSEARDEWESEGSSVVIRYMQLGPSGDWVRFFMAVPFED